MSYAIALIIFLLAMPVAAWVWCFVFSVGLDDHEEKRRQFDEWEEVGDE